MEGTYRFFCYADDTIRLVYSDRRDGRFMRFFDMTAQMFEAVKSPFLEEMFWKWSTGGGELDAEDPRICYMGNNRKGDEA